MEWGTYVEQFFFSWIEVSAVIELRPLMRLLMNSLLRSMRWASCLGKTGVTGLALILDLVLVSFGWLEFEMA